MMQLMVVDDEPAICAFVQTVAESCGYEVMSCTDEQQVMSAIAAAKPDVIVLDLTMPDLDGIEVLRNLASQHSQAKVFIMSGFDARVRDVAFDLGKVLGLSMAGIIPKPIRAPQLRELLAPLAK
jgi:CheY-like chemotaxis protein